MNDPHDDYKSSIDNWAEKWQKAQEQGIFKDEPKPPVTSADSGQQSFFGITQGRSENRIKDVDAEYWRRVHAMADQEPDKIMQEMLKPDIPAPAAPTVDKKSLGNMVSRIAQSPNPIPAWTVGKDSDPLPGETVPSYTEEDLKQLADLKVKMQALQEKLISVEALGEKNKAFETQIKNLQKEIDVLSDAIADTFSPAPNGGK
jgi:hypothetical protein